MVITKEFNLSWKIYSFVKTHTLLKSFIFKLNKIYGSLFSNLSITIDTNRFYAHTLDRMIALIMLKHHLLENFETKVFKKIVRKKWHIVDIGANLGYYTILTGKIIGEKGKVYAFEPNKECAKMLSKNVSANTLYNVEVIQAAVSDKTGTITLYISEDNSGDHRTYNSLEKRKSYTVKTYALDTFFDLNEKIDLVKIDVQGFEMKVLLGMKKLIKKNARIILICEFWPQGLIEAGYSPIKFLTLIKKLGFSINYIDERKGKINSASAKGILKMCEKSHDINLFLSKFPINKLIV